MMEQIKKLWETSSRGKIPEIKPYPMIQHYLLSQSCHILRYSHNGDEAFWADSVKLEGAKVHRDYPQNVKDHHKIYERLFDKSELEDSGDESEEELQEVEEKYLEEVKVKVQKADPPAPPPAKKSNTKHEDHEGSPLPLFRL